MTFKHRTMTGYECHCGWQGTVLGFIRVTFHALAHGHMPVRSR